MPQWFARKASLSEALPAHASSALRMPVSVGMKSPCVHRCRWGSQAAALRPSGRAPALAPSLCCQGGHTGSNSAHSLGRWERFPPTHPGPLVLPPDPSCLPATRGPCSLHMPAFHFSVSASQFPCPSPSLCVFLCLCLSLLLSLSLSISVSLCLCLSLHLCLCLHLSLLTPISLSLSLFFLRFSFLLPFSPGEQSSTYHVC